MVLNIRSRSLILVYLNITEGTFRRKYLRKSIATTEAVELKVTSMPLLEICLELVYLEFCLE